MPFDLRTSGECKSEIDELLKKLRKMKIGSYSRINLTKYAFILVAEYLKTAFIEAFLNYYMQKTSDVYINNHFYNTMRYWNRELKKEVIVGFLRRMDSRLETELEDFVKKRGLDLRKFYLSCDSVVDNRNNIAHFQIVTVNENDLRNWYYDIYVFIILLSDFLFKKLKLS